MGGGLGALAKIHKRITGMIPSWLQGDDEG
jgi:hypothetical protein